MSESFAGEHLPAEASIPTHSGNWRPTDTNLLRAVAAVLISNSHLEQLYKPRSWMAGDGLLGMLMFFFLSGFGISLASKSRMKGFLPWMGRRIMRIYPAVILSILVIPFGIYSWWRTVPPLGYAQIFLYPTLYPFVGQIIIVYCMLYWLLRPLSRGPLFGALVLMVLVATGRYAFTIGRWPAAEPLSMGNELISPFLWYAYTSMALLGALFAPMTSRPAGTFIRDLILLIGLFGLYVATKYAMVHGHYPRWCFLLVLMGIGITLLLLRVSAGDPMQMLFQRVKPIGWFASLLAGITLEMYIMQTWTPELPIIQRLHLPMNLAIFWIVTIPGAVVLAKVTAFLVGLLTKRPRRVPVTA